MRGNSNEKKIRVLEVCHGLAPGGIEAFVLNIFNNIDREQFEIDFAVASDGKQFHEDKVLEEGARVFHTSDLDGIGPMIKHFFRLIKILKNEGPFDVVHTHIDFFNGVNLLAAFIAGVPIRISHSHNTHSAGAITSKVSFPIKIYRLLMRVLINLFSNVKVGCSTLANSYMYGEKVVKAKKTHVIWNGIDLNTFKDNHFNYEKISEETKQINLITIGRICEQKNSLFIVEIMKELLKLDSRYHLTWIGKGPQEAAVQELVQKYQLQKHINFIGNTKKVSTYLSKSDFFIFPSQWEGLPVVLVEAQISGVPCFISNKITKEVDLGLITYINIDQGAEYFAQLVNHQIKSKGYKHVINKKKVALFDIRNVVKKTSSIYRGQIGG